MITSLFIYLGALLSLILITYFCLTKSEKGWVFSIGGISFILSIFLFVFGGAMLTTKYNEYSYVNNTLIRYQIVSLMNSLQPTGEISGSGSFLRNYFSGGLKSETLCTFVIKKDNSEIVIENIPASKIVFFETDDGSQKVEQVFYNFNYPHRFTEQGRNLTYHFESENTWRIYLPKESFNKYIKFN